MKIEYLEHGSKDCPLIRIFGDDPSAARTLSDALMKLADGKTMDVAIHDLPGFESVAGCQLIAHAGNKDIGIRKLHVRNVFECILAKETWAQVAELILPFCYAFDYNAHQWLDERSDIALLISNDDQGTW